MRSFLIIAALCSLAATLAGCRSVFDPTFMPSGYTYHNDEFKAPPGPPSKHIGYDYSGTINDVVVERWKDVAHAIIARMESEKDIGPQRVYVERLPDHNAFNASFDYALRDELRARGYTLVSVPAGVLSLRPAAYRPEDVKVPVDANAYNGDPEISVTPEKPGQPDRFIVSLTLLRSTLVTGEVSDSFDLPAYGYVRGEGQNRIDPRLPKKEPPPAAPCAQPCDKPCMMKDSGKKCMMGDADNHESVPEKLVPDGVSPKAVVEGVIGEKI